MQEQKDTGDWGVLKQHRLLLHPLKFADSVSDSSHQKKKLVLPRKTGIMKREPQSQTASILLEGVTHGKARLRQYGAGPRQSPKF